MNIKRHRWRRILCYAAVLCCSYFWAAVTPNPLLPYPMIPMARSLRASSPHIKFAPSISLPSISGNDPLINFPDHRRSYSLSRFLCTCANQRAAIDISRYRKAFADRMAMAGLKPHNRVGNYILWVLPPLGFWITKLLISCYKFAYAILCNHMSGAVFSWAYEKKKKSIFFLCQDICSEYLGLCNLQKSVPWHQWYLILHR